LLIITLVVNLYAQDWNQIGNAFKIAEKIYIDSTYKFVYINQVEKIYNYKIKTIYVYFDYDAINGGYKRFGYKLDTVPKTYEFRNSYNTTEKYVAVINNTTIKIPAPIYDRYVFGHTLMKAGWINFSIGTGIAAIGGILYGSGAKNNNLNKIKAGGALLGIGGTIFGISIPLLCFGDNAKREANTLLKTYDILK
jgi:hypothetical protein